MLQSNLAIFDLDNTLLAGDSDYLWGRFLVDEGVVDGEHYERENERFYRDYQAGRLDIYAWLAFQLRPLAEEKPDRLYRLRERFLAERIRPIILPAGRALIAKHRAQGDEPLIITATNAFITQPIAELLDVGQLLATDPEMIDGRYTGRVTGTPCFREGKIVRLEQWLAGRDGDPDEQLGASWFYSDSHNDLPLLERVGHPVAVDPDEELARCAARRSWPIISLR